MITPLLLLGAALIADGVFRHPRLVRFDAATLAADAPLPPPTFAVCTTPLPASFCACGRYALFEADDAPDQEPPACPLC